MPALPAHLSFPSQEEAAQVAAILTAQGYTVQLDRAFLDTDAPREAIQRAWDSIP